MKSKIATAVAIFGLALAAASVVAFAQVKSEATTKKKVLVELYTSQGCDSCPSASDLFGQLAKLGYGPDQIVPVNFHVDYFNDPWVDRFSNSTYSRRQMSYNEVQKRNDLYFTPMMMVDGRTPLLGSNRPLALAAIKKALKEPPGVALELVLERAEGACALNVEVAALMNETMGRDLLVGVAVVEDEVTTHVRSGENAGKTLVEPFTVRAFVHKFIRLERAGKKAVTFPLSLPSDAVLGQVRVAVFVQDRANGKVYQAHALPWVEARRVR